MALSRRQLLLGAGALGLLGADQARALDPVVRQILLGGVPYWVRAKYGSLAPFVTFAAHDDAGLYWAKGYGNLPESACFSNTRTGTRWYANAAGDYVSAPSNQTLVMPDGTGAILFEARTNLFLNSQAPVTQTITVVSSSVYTVSVVGTASVALSGAGSGTATQGSPVTFTAGSTSLVATVSGAGGVFQNVNVTPGAFAAPPIVTLGSTATVGADIRQLIGPALAAALAAKGAYIETNAVAGTTGFNRTVSYDTINSYMGLGPSTTASITNGTNTQSATFGSGSYSGVAKTAFGYSAAAEAAIANGGTRGSQNNGWLTPSGSTYYGNNSGGIRALNGLGRKLAFLSVDPTTTAGLTS